MFKASPPNVSFGQNFMDRKGPMTYEETCGTLDAHSDHDDEARSPTSKDLYLCYFRATRIPTRSQTGPRSRSSTRSRY